MNKQHTKTNQTKLDQINAQLQEEERKQDALRKEINESLHTWAKLKAESRKDWQGEDGACDSHCEWS